MTAGARREAAEILRRIVELLPKITPGQRDYLQGVAAGLELKVSRRSRLVGEARPAESTSTPDSAERD